mmetsp:Transcript_26308/g.41155  ORF Transcript_26308/g.41155 Transcript_26308/m.41155 type:complete len:224 (+) Transcript_26308:114-785(+)|eukprot:CAMPEP_0184300452 /NCGR_PEP_ID=MMETSP1049-20130417/10856_1 /TAXON_ID=77928 /ORGANISM="Proteomonas sulcata, Strain CCMP704" /LENGTH=223 /DNA_ID=CAMNT_0026611171 /DNA_START=63 /DNA_END=734 /DNA_ORIENTATION=+
MSANDKIGGKPLFEYLELPVPISARGGVTRFFMLAHEIDFDEKLHPLSTWGSTTKPEYIASGKNPTGQLPIVTIGGKTLTQHIAIIRLFARQMGECGSDPVGDYGQDAVGDEYQGFRDAYVSQGLFGSDDAKAKYIASIPGRLKDMEALVGKYQVGPGPYISKSTSGKPLWGDSAVFSLVWDHIQVGMVKTEDLDQYPKIKAIFEAYKGSSDRVKDWIASKTA